MVSFVCTVSHTYLRSRVVLTNMLTFWYPSTAKGHQKLSRGPPRLDRDIFRHYPTIFDIIQHYLTTFNIFWQYPTSFDTICHFSTIFNIFRKFDNIRYYLIIFNIIQHYYMQFDIFRHFSLNKSKNVAVHNFYCRIMLQTSLRSTLGRIYKVRYCRSPLLPFDIAGQYISAF